MSSVSRGQHRFSFRPVQPEDLPLITRWRRAEHVERWWGQPGDMEAEYFRHGEPVHYFLALMDGSPVGVIEHYRWSDYPSEAEPLGAQSGEDGIDYFLGEAGLTGRGLGPAMLQSFLTQIVRADSSVRGVRVSVSESNRPSWRCLEKLGFRREREGVADAVEPGPHFVYALGFGEEADVADHDVQ